MVGINHVTGEWWWIPGTLGLKQGCPMKDADLFTPAYFLRFWAPNYALLITITKLRT